MVRFASTNILIFLLCGFILCSCTGTFPPDKIDPTGNLTRAEYIALRQRGQDKSSHQLVEAQNQESQAHNNPQQSSSGKPPPIPALPDTTNVENEGFENAAQANENKAELANSPKNLLQKKVSVSVTENVPLREILVELAKRGEVNLELDPRVNGNIIFSAYEQPFSVVLQRICALANLRYKYDGPFLRIELDEPYQQNYSVDYLSLSRKTTSGIALATNVFDVDVSSSGSGANGISGSAGDNNSTAKIEGNSEADFWAELSKSLRQVVKTASNIQSPNNQQSEPTFSIDKQAGIVTVLGNSRQQDAVANYLKKLQEKASAQVLIEGRIVEVELNENFQSGINWRTLFDNGLNVAARFGTVGAGAPFSTATTAADGAFSAAVNTGDINGILNLVRDFGTTRILSAPRLTVLNNQTAVLKVARNEVYFVTQAQFPTTVSTSGVPVSGTPVFSSTPRTVPVGLVMTVQPAINAETGRITLTVRPTISRVVSRVNDPSIGLNAAQAGISTPVQSQIPVLAVRELDSILQLNSGEVAIMGGLMQDGSENSEEGVPPFDSVPILGNLAKSRNNNGNTSELVILLRATILQNAKPGNADIDLYRRYNNDPRPMNFQKNEPVRKSKNLAANNPTNTSKETAINIEPKINKETDINNEPKIRKETDININEDIKNETNLNTDTEISKVANANETSSSLITAHDIGEKNSSYIAAESSYPQNGQTSRKAAPSNFNKTKPFVLTQPDQRAAEPDTETTPTNPTEQLD